MKLKTESYNAYEQRLPQTGTQIIAYQEEDMIVVYQAYKNSIANYAVANQKLGGNDFKFSRMSWIKPNFLWMMYRSGWAQKESQERILAFWIKKQDWETILKEAVLSSLNQEVYPDHDTWKEVMTKSQVRLQWDPDHNPYGEKMKRKAIQIGMKGEVLEKFGTEYVEKIEDVTDFVKEQFVFVKEKNLEKLQIPTETVYSLQNNVQIGQNYYPIKL